MLTRLLRPWCGARRGCSLSVIGLNSLVMNDPPLCSENQAAVTQIHIRLTDTNRGRRWGKNIKKKEADIYLKTYQTLIEYTFGNAVYEGRIKQPQTPYCSFFIEELSCHNVLFQVGGLEDG